MKSGVVHFLLSALEVLFFNDMVLFTHLNTVLSVAGMLLDLNI